MTAPLPEEVLRGLLRRFGWKTVDRFRDAIEYWAPASGRRDDETLMFPLDPNAPDFGRLLALASDKLRELYGAEFDRGIELVELMLDQRLDEVDVRKETDNRAGLIPWDAGNRMIESARGLLGAAARASNAPKRRFAQSQSVIAEEFLRSCYMGQTRVGSYVVTALVPTREPLATSRSESERATPRHLTGREVTATLVGALEAVQVAVRETREEDQQLEAFEQAVPLGVSYELLTSLQLLTDGKESSVSVEYNQSGLNPLQADTQRRDFEFTRDDGLVIARARRHFEASPEPVHTVVTGEVTLLKNAESTAEHQIRVLGRVNGKPRTVIVNLSAVEYEKAVTAHGQKRLLTVIGDLERRQRGSLIENPRFVAITDVPVGGTMPESQMTLWAEST